jgi:hypothetical protein
MNGDRRDDIALIVAVGGSFQIQLWGLTGPIERPVFEPFESVGIEFNAIPLVVPANVDHDTAVLEYSPVQSSLVFSEPVVVAAIAAPPCRDGAGQNVEACTSSYGRADSLETGVERSVTLSASVMAGFSVEDRTFTQSEFDLEVSSKLTLTHKQSATYTTEKSISYTTGSLEDAVVFTSIPYDRYVYTYVSHPDPEAVGEQLVVSVPREPVTLMVERSFYNEHAVEGAPKIDDEVFRHAAGEPASYPSPADKNETLDRFGGMELGAVSVDQGSGEKELGIEVGAEFGTELSMSLSTEFALATTVGGVQFGFTLGREDELGLSISGGSTTSFAGTVGAIDRDHFGEQRYSFGLFTYVHELPDGRAFDVVNYWVE